MTRRAIILFAAIGIIWGIPYLFIKVAVAELSPAMLVLARTSLAAVLLLPLAVGRGQVRPVLRSWRPLVAYTAVEIIVPWFFLSAAEQRVPSSLAALLVSAVPLVGVGVAFAFGRSERLSRTNWLGIALGMIGVAALVGLDTSGADLIGVAMIAVVVVGYAVGPAILSRWMSDLPALGVVALSLAISAVVYIPIVLFSGGWPASVPSAQVIGSVAVLGIVCSAIAFLIMFALVAEIGPVRFTAITYVNPAVAVIAGALVLNEPVTISTLIGFGLVLAGSYLVTQHRAREAAPVDARATLAVAETALAECRAEP